MVAGSHTMTCEPPPRLRRHGGLRRIFLNAAATPPHEEGNMQRTKILSRMLREQPGRNASTIAAISLQSGNAAQESCCPDDRLHTSTAAAGKAAAARWQVLDRCPETGRSDVRRERRTR